MRVVAAVCILVACCAIAVEGTSLFANLRSMAPRETLSNFFHFGRQSSPVAPQQLKIPSSGAGLTPRAHSPKKAGPAVGHDGRHRGAKYAVVPDPEGTNRFPQLVPASIDISFCTADDIDPSSCRAAARAIGLMTVFDRVYLEPNRLSFSDSFKILSAGIQNYIFNNARSQDNINLITKLAGEQIAVLLGTNENVCRLFKYIDKILVMYDPRSSEEAAIFNFIDRLGESLARAVEPSREVELSVVDGIKRATQQTHPCAARKNPFYDTGKAARESNHDFYRENVPCPGGTKFNRMCATKYRNLPCMSNDRNSDQGNHFMCHSSTLATDFNGLPASPLTCQFGGLIMPEVCERTYCAKSITCPARADGSFVCSVPSAAWTTDNTKKRPYRLRPSTSQFLAEAEHLWICQQAATPRDYNGGVLKTVYAPCETTHTCPLHPTVHKYGYAPSNAAMEMPLLAGHDDDGSDDHGSDDDGSDDDGSEKYYTPRSSFSDPKVLLTKELQVRALVLPRSAMKGTKPKSPGRNIAF